MDGHTHAQDGLRACCLVAGPLQLESWALWGRWELRWDSREVLTIHLLAQLLVAASVGHRGRRLQMESCLGEAGTRGRGVRSVGEEETGCPLTLSLQGYGRARPLQQQGLLQCPAQQLASPAEAGPWGAFQPETRTVGLFGFSLKSLGTTGGF